MAHHYCQPSVFPFLGANGAVEAGHQVEIHMLRDAVVLMKDAVANGVVPVGWPPLKEVLATTVKNRTPIYV